MSTASGPSALGCRPVPNNGKAVVRSTRVSGAGGRPGPVPPACALTSVGLRLPVGGGGGAPRGASTPGSAPAHIKYVVFFTPPPEHLPPGAPAAREPHFCTSCRSSRPRTHLRNRCRSAACPDGQRKPCRPECEQSKILAHPPHVVSIIFSIKYNYLSAATTTRARHDRTSPKPRTPTAATPDCTRRRKRTRRSAHFLPIKAWREHRCVRESPRPRLQARNRPRTTCHRLHDARESRPRFLAWVLPGRFAVAHLHVVGHYRDLGVIGTAARFIGTTAGNPARTAVRPP